MKIPKTVSLYTFLAIVLTVIGFLIRIINVSELSIWVDEFVHINRVQGFLNGTSPIFTHDNNGILLTYILIPIFKFISSTPLWARLPSVLFGTGSIFLIYFLGKRLYNNYVGLIAAFLNTFSLYLIYWSRLTRNYAIFEFFFLLFLVLLFNFFEPTTLKTKFNLLKKTNVSVKALILVMIAFIFSFFSHQLSFFAIFSVAVYLGILGIVTLIKKRKKEPNKFKYIYLGIPSLILVVLLFMPFLENSIKSILNLMLPQKVTEWVVPDWERVQLLFKTKKYFTYILYKDVFLYDMGKFLIIISITGMIWGFIKQFKPTFYIFSFLVIPFLLMSFIFREPALPRYIIYIYPLVHILTGLFFYNIYLFLSRHVKSANTPAFKISLIVISLIIVASQFKTKEVRNLVRAKTKIGHIVSKKLSHWAFTNYSIPCQYILKNLKPNDIIFSTQKNAADYYLDRKDAIHFRQTYYNTTKKKYEYCKPDTINELSGRSIKNLQQVYNKHNRGWLLVDYYFDNVMTSPQARHWVFRHMNYHEEATKDGSARVFSWDKTKPVPRYQQLVEDLGKSHTRIASPYYFLTVDKKRIKKQLKVTVIAKNISTKDEAYILFNDKHYIPIPPNKKSNIEQLTLFIDKKQIMDKQNKIKFVYNTKVRNDVKKGFIIYALNITYL